MSLKELIKNCSHELLDLFLIATIIIGVFIIFDNTIMTFMLVLLKSLPNMTHENVTLVTAVLLTGLFSIYGIDLLIKYVVKPFIVWVCDMPLKSLRDKLIAYKQSLTYEQAKELWTEVKTNSKKKLEKK